MPTRDERIKREIKGPFNQFRASRPWTLYPSTHSGQVAKSIVSAHGGIIWAESDGEGKRKQIIC